MKCAGAFVHIALARYSAFKALLAASSRLVNAARKRMFCFLSRTVLPEVLQR